jgi:hypothetical protein
VGEAYVCEKDGNSFSGMGISSLVKVTNEAVMSGCESHTSMSNDDRNKVEEFIYEEEERLVGGIDGRLYNEEDKIEKLKAEKRRRKRKPGSTKWEPQLNDHVLIRIHPMSDAVRGITSKFIRPYEGPYVITEVLSPSMFEISDLNGKARGKYNKQSLKPYL